MGNPGREPAGDVVGDVHAADRDVIGKNQIPVEEHADRRRSAAHVDNGDAETDLVLHEAGEPRGVGADNESLDLEMRAPNGGGVVAHAGCARRHHMHVDAEPLAEHAARITDAAAVVDRKPHRDGMDDLTITRVAHHIAVLEHPPHLGIGDLASGDADLRLDDP